MPINKRANLGYSSGIPLNAGDRYYSQDLGRDLWFLFDSIGHAVKDLVLSKSKIIISGGVVSQGSGTTLNITSGVLYAPFAVTIPDTFASIPPSTKSANIDLMRIVLQSQANFAIPYAVADGATPNYVKVKYIESNGQTRDKAKKVGNYAYEIIPYFLITVNDTAPTTYEVCLGTFTLTAGGVFTFSTTLRDYYLPIISTDGTFASNSDSLYPSEKAVKTFASPKAPTPTNGDIATVSGSGELLDSGKSFSTDTTLAGNSDLLSSTQKAVKVYVDQKKMQSSTVSNSPGAINTTEAVISIGLLVPANLLTVGSTYKCRIHGTCTATIANASTFRVRFGTANDKTDAIISNFSITSATSGSGNPFVIDIEITVRTIGATGTTYSIAVLYNSGIIGIATVSVNAIVPTASAINTTLNSYFNITYQSAATTTTSTFQRVVQEISLN